MNIGNIVVVVIIGALWGAGAATAITLLVLRRRYAKHLELVRMGMGQIAAGDLTYRLAIETGDDFAMLAARFNDIDTLPFPSTNRA